MPLVAGVDINLTMKQGTTISSNELTQWVDQTANGYTLQPHVAGAADAPRTDQDSLNGTPVCALNVTAEGQALGLSDVSYDFPANSGDTYTFQGVVKIPSTQSGFPNCMIDGYDTAARNSILFDDAPQVWVKIGTNTSSDTPITVDEYIVLTVKVVDDGNGSSSTVTIWENDTKILNGETVGRQLLSRGDGITLGAYGGASSGGWGKYYLAQMVEYINTDLTDQQITDNVSYLQAEWGLVTADTTPPTYTTDGNLTMGSNSDTSSVEITFDKAQDETTAQSSIVYRLYRAPENNDISTLSAIDTNGTEVASGTDVTALVDTPITAGETYEYNVTAEDEAINRLAYNQLEVLANTLKGTVTLEGNPIQGAHVMVHTVTAFDFSNRTFKEILQTDASGEYVVTNYDDTLHYFISVLYLKEDYASTATGGTATTLEDTSQSWATDEFSDGQSFVEITGGTGVAQIRRIISNTSTTITIEYDWSMIPDGTSTYRIGKAYSDESRFVQSKSTK